MGPRSPSLRHCAPRGGSGQWVCLAHSVFKSVAATRGVVENSLVVLRLAGVSVSYPQDKSLESTPQTGAF